MEHPTNVNNTVPNVNNTVPNVNNTEPKINLNDHRKIGLDQKLFFFHDSSPGSCFFLPHGTIIYNKMVEFIRCEYKKRGFTEVITPNIYNKKLWETSGHWQHYQKNMFKIDIKNNDNNNSNSICNSNNNSKTGYIKNDTDIYALKPMNCNGHCLIFAHTYRSYRELPLRLADFGVLHRNECHGALTGLTRVRKFCQDDAHIYCRDDQVESEIMNCLEFLKHVYGIFGFEFSLELSTRPDEYIGNLDTWEKAEEQLRKVLDISGMPWTLNPADGAFYGPKIDIKIKDSLSRSHQCATIQLDFNLPEKFNLFYQKEDGTYTRPVMIHRAIYGSIERMFAILCEHYQGRWPFWLSPRQICIIPVTKIFNDYAKKVYQIYHDAGFNVELDISTDGLNKKIKVAQIQQFNFIFVVGGVEEQSNTVNVRNREQKDELGVFSHEEVIKNFNKLRNEHTIENKF